MRFLSIVALVVVMVPAVARAQGSPPSPTLERAIKLYDREDYLSATIELAKVRSGETGDDAANLQRADFFQAKAVYQLGFYVPSLVLFQQIEADPAHAYRDAALEWVLAIARELPETSGVLETIARYERGSSAITALGERYDEYAVMSGRAMFARNDYEAALSSLNMVPKDSGWWPAAQHQRGLVMFRLADAEAGIAAMVDATTDPLIAPLAVHDLAFWSRLLGEPAAAGEALRALASDEGPVAAAARLASSRLAVEARGELSELRGLTDTLDALVIVTVCGHGAVSGHALDGLGGAVSDEMRAMARHDDNAELFEAVRKRLTIADDTASALRLSLGLADPMRWAAEVARELRIFAKADAAWLTTMVAVDIQTELELQRALAEATAGQWLRTRFEQIGAELELVEESGVRLDAAPAGDDLVVTGALCDAAGLPHAATSRPGLDAIPLTPTPTQGRGCGCTTTGGGADLGGLLLVLLVARRGARRRLTPDRQLE